MKWFIEHIEKQSEQALEQLAKSSIQFLFSPSSENTFGSSTILVGDVSIPIGEEQYVIIKNDWADTPEEWLDYYFLSAHISDQPNDIEVEKLKKGFMYKGNHMTFHIGKLEEVKKVIVLEDIYKGDEEGVKYDAGILIEIHDNKKILIIRDESISGQLLIISDSKEIELCLSSLEDRIIFGQ